MTELRTETVRGMKKGVPIDQLYNQMKEQREMKRDYTANQGGLRVEIGKEPTEAELNAKWQPESTALDELLGKTDIEPREDESLDALLNKVDLTKELPGEEGNGREDIPLINLEGIGEFPMSDLFHRQLASHLKIPKAYYDRMLYGDPKLTQEQRDVTKNVRHALLVENLNTWLNLKSGDMRLVRTMGGKARAYLSNAYRCIDNFDLATSVIQEIMVMNNTNDMGIYCASANVTENYMHMKFTTKKLSGEVKVGDIVQAGLVIKNSEVGLASLSVEPMIIRLVCWNGAVMATAIKRRHVGSRSMLGDSNVEELLSDATKKLSDQALMAKIRDVVKGSLKEDIFNGNLEILKASDSRTLDYKGANVSAKPVIRELSKRHNFSDAEGETILDSYMQTIGDTGQTQWGMGNAVTLAAGRSKSYDRASDMEKTGGEIFKMDDGAWESLMRSAS